MTSAGLFVPHRILQHDCTQLMYLNFISMLLMFCWVSRGKWTIEHYISVCVC